jgi:hypothetical protein
MNAGTERVFSRSSVRFDHSPEDSELVCLLGDRDCPGSIDVLETSDSLVVRPGLFRMKYVVPWMLLVASGMTAAPWIARHFGNNLAFGPALWLFVAMMWLLVLPSLFLLLVFMNRSFASKGDYFRVDKSALTFTLCQAGKTCKAAEILAFTELSRWCRYGHVPWGATRQTGVLLRAPGGRVDLYPLFRELGENIPLFGRRQRLVDRLAEVFQVPVRRVKLGRRESRALGDC